MSLMITQSDYFWADLQRQVDWYRDRAGPEIATAYVSAVETTLHHLARTPRIGRLRFWHWPELGGIRSWRVRKPYHRHLIFYRFDEETLFAERIIHGARDLPGRLLELPYNEQD